MKRPNIFTKNSSGASPVIGVMLMVVVTVILAAAVSAYSTGMLRGTEVAPSASFDVEMRKDISTFHGNMSYIAITMVTGEKIPSKDLKIVTINPNAEGEYKTREILPNIYNTKTKSFTGASPFWNLGNYPTTGQFFGEYLLEPGMTVIADEYANYVGAVWDENDGTYITDVDGHITAMQAMFADWGDEPDNPSDDTLHPGDVFTIKIIHTPTNQVIFTKDVVVSS
ncbi:type IV pilin N-terminal domain-containing protein [Methanolobus psychrotolerans]|uniref:type IV pilin N-terminal domain-containing protein n=1 Tax=Methanolobus psychrotolerans TaxID=1874706 RepID=UPI000B9156AD|nr:type IV pilin N-terminal domain-containing protein [Methanolobus psychrotolerans]